MVTAFAILAMFLIRARPSPPLIRAMPERKHFFSKEVFPCILIYFNILTNILALYEYCVQQCVAFRHNEL